MKTCTAVTLLAAAFAMPASADIGDNLDVQAATELANAWVQTQLGYDNVPGGSVAAVWDQEVIWSTGFGYARLKGRVPATADTKYSICSVSKLFTSIGVLQQRDAGTLSLDAPIGDLLSWYDLPSHAKAEEPVTLRNILSHVAGLPREAVTPYWVDVKFPSSEEIRSGLASQSPYYRPYERFQYSNLGLTLAGEAVAAASGKDYHTYIRNHILDPLGLHDTTSELPVDEYGKSFAAGYKLRDSKGDRTEVGKYTVNGIAPAAGFASTVNDLAKFASWQFRLREKGGTEVLKETTLREMQRVHWIEPDGGGAVWGLGFALSKVDGKTFIGHGGYCPGYRTAFLTRPEDKFAVIAMVNVNDASPSDLARGIAAIMTDPVKKAAKPNGEKSATVEDFSLYEGTFGREGLPNSMRFAATTKGLKSVSLYAAKPGNALISYLPEGDHVFRVLSRDKEKLDTIRFELDNSGTVVKVWRHGQYLDKLSD